MKIYKTGMKIRYEATDFDGTTVMEGIVTEVHKDHVIVSTPDPRSPRLWLDEETEYMFTIMEE